MEEKLKAKLDSLYKIYEMYSKLYKETRHYGWRVQGIEAQIDILEDLLNDNNSITEKWLKCYKEDVQEAKQENYFKGGHKI